jgi:hypothetical protein
LQITAVTKSGTNQFRGTGYDLLTKSDWNTNRELNILNGDPKPVASTKTLGYAIGGPVGKPGGHNKLFFYYAHEFRPTNNPINSGNPIRMKVPTAAERAGDFSQTVDQNGAPFPYIKNPAVAGTCSAADQTACFAYNGVLGRIPPNLLYPLGQTILNRYPLPNLTQQPATNYNYQIGGAGYPALPTVNQLLQQPAVRVDYQLSSKTRITGKYSGERQRALVTPGLIPGFSDVLFPYPFITNYAVTATHMLTPSTFLEGTYGFIRNELTGGNENGILVNNAANRLTELPNFPLLYPNAGVVPTRSYAYQVLQAVKPPFWDGTNINLPPVFNWGSRIGGTNALPAPPNQRYPGWLNINRTQDIAISLTKVAGRHTMKAGFYNNHSFKAQNVGAGGIANLSFQSYVDFGNSANNPLDTGFGYSNAILGIFNQDLQASTFVEGSMIYNNREFYVQDNWKVNSRLTVDGGLRFTHQQPQYDQFQQMSNFFPDKWLAANAPVLYIAGCSNGAVVCSGNVRNAMNPITGQILLPPSGVGNTQAAIGTPIPGIGNTLNGIVQAGNGISKYGYTWPALVVGPRFGFAYDLTGRQDWILRGGGGVFYDRPDGNTVFSIPGNPPIATSTDVRSGNLQTLGQGLSFGPVPALVTFQYNAKVPASVQWEVGVQKTLPWASVVDVSYVGNHGYNRLGAFQGGSTVNQNAIDFGTAYLPKYQDPTLLPQAVPGAGAYSQSALLRPYQGLSNINQNTTDFHDTYHSIQTNFNRRFRNSFSFGVNYVLSLSFTGNTGLQQRLQHAPDGTISIRADQAQYESLLNQLNLQRHLVKLNWVWGIPGIHSPESTGMKAVAAVVNNWQLSGIFTGGSGSRYDLGYSYNSLGGNPNQNVNLTGSPDYAARIVYTGNPGSGCSSNRFAQFTTTAVAGPTYNSVGLESGRNVLIGCPDHTTNLAIARNIPYWKGGRMVTLRLDAYNLFNVAIITGRQGTVTYNNPTDQVVQNSQTLPDGSINPARLTPRSAGFGAANAFSTNDINTNYQRVIQLTFRVSF